MKINNVSIEKIIPYDKNPRLNDHAVNKVATSIKEFGFRQPIVTDENLVIIAGHTRYEAAKKLGLIEVPVHIAEGLTEKQIKAYRIADNRIAQESKWDLDLLKIELSDLQEHNIDLGITGFDLYEINNIFAEGGIDPNEEWRGMPDFNQDDKTSFRQIIIHFQNEAMVYDFARLIGQNITDKTKSLWHPAQTRMDTESKRY